MPVSRKRKETRKSKKNPARVAGQPAPAVSPVFAQLATHRRDLHARRTSLAAEAAGSLVAELAGRAPASTDSELEERLCALVGPQLAAWEEAPIEDHVGPERFGEALVDSAVAKVAASLADRADPDGWRVPWRVLATIVRTAPRSMRELAAASIEQLRRQPGGRALPALPASPAVPADRVLWARDGYGSRFGVVSAFPAPDGHERWYLWDIDACGFNVCTVYSGYFATAEEAFAHWQAGVGQVAAKDAKLTPADDASLLAALLPYEEGFMRIGGENAAQFAEYYRSRCLAEAVRGAVRPSSTRNPPDREAVVSEATTGFAAWLRDHRAAEPPTSDLAELIEELADSWCIDYPPALYDSCSPHRVALTVLHLRDYYQDDFATSLVALLPDWVSWLSTRNGTPPELAERCRPYAAGAPHPGIDVDGRARSPYVRIAE